MPLNPLVDVCWCSSSNPYMWSLWPGNTTLADTKFSHIAGDMYHYIRSIDHISFNSIHSYGKSNFQTHSYTISNCLALVDIPKYCIKLIGFPMSPLNSHWAPFFWFLLCGTYLNVEISARFPRHRGDTGDIGSEQLVASHPVRRSHVYTPKGQTSNTSGRAVWENDENVRKV